MTGIEPATTGATVRYSNQLSYTHHICFAIKMARLEGLEPPAYCLEGSCSIQLSYRRVPLTAFAEAREQL